VYTIKQCPVLRARILKAGPKVIISESENEGVENMLRISSTPTEKYVKTYKILSPPFLDSYI
jgi:hypothetical protein